MKRYLISDKKNMRFKKLRLSVGIALVLFVLVAGNVIVFGLIQKAGFGNGGSASDNSINAAVIDTDKSPSIAINSQQQQPAATDPPAPAPSQPTIVHKRIVSSAS